MMKNLNRINYSIFENSLNIIFRVYFIDLLEVLVKYI